MKLPIRYEHISYEGGDFYDADGEYVTAEQIVEYINRSHEVNQRDAARFTTSTRGVPNFHNYRET